MSPVTCRYCGLPFRVRRVEPGRAYFCCTGCAILARVPVDAQGNYPVNGPLVAGLTLAFLYFNQVLAWLVGLLLAREGRVALADRFAWVSAAAAVIVWAAVLVLQRRGGVSRGKDHVVAALVLGLLIASSRTLPPSGAVCAAANAVLLVWNFRGVVRKRKTEGRKG